VFNATESASRFSAADKCPAYKVREDIMSLVRDKQRRDETQTAELISRVPAAPTRMGVDGGMNPTFLAAVKSHGGGGADIKTASGTIPSHVNPPEAVAETPTGSFMSLASAESKPAPAPAPAQRSTVQVASAGGSGGGIGSFFGNLFGSKSEEQAAEKPAATPPKTKPAAAAKATQTASVARPKAEPQPAATKTASAAPPAKPPSQTQQASAEEPPTSKPAASSSNLLSGAAPTMPSNGFEGRFGAWR
jgi:outer membrane biosynthesis protein TonB